MRGTYVGEVLTGVSATRLLTSSSRDDSLDSALKEVTELKGLNKVRIPDHASVLDANLSEAVVDLADFFDTLIQRLLGTIVAVNKLVSGKKHRGRIVNIPEDSSISLHGLLEIQPNLSSGQRTVCIPNLVKEFHSL